MQKSGLVSVSFRSLSVEQVCRAASAAGLDAVEWGSDVHVPYDAPERQEETVLLQKKYGLTCCSYGTYFRLGVTPTEELHGYIAAARKLGTSILRVWCGDRAADRYTAEEREELLAACRAAAEIAEAAGVILCMECHHHSFTETVDGALLLMKTVGSSAFRMYWQPNQYRTVEENLAYAAAIAPYTPVIHVFNWEGDARMPLGEASAIWRRYLDCFDGTQSLLLEFMPDDRAESLPTEAAALRELIGGEKL